MVVCFAVVAAPYIVWLSEQTGGIRLQTKSTLNVATELRIQQGLSGYAASFAVSPELVAEGIWVRPNIDVIRESSFSVADYVGLFTKKVQRLARDFGAIVGGSLEFGSPSLFALAVLGIFGRPWRVRIVIDQLHLFVLLALSVLAQFFIYYSSLRFYVLLLAVFCIWASAGSLRLAEWARLTLSGAGRSARAQQLASCAALVAAFAAILAPATLIAAKDALWARGSRPIKELASSFTYGPSRLKIADTSTPFAFHANAEFVWLPHSSEQTALAYLAKKHVTHVVLRSLHLSESGVHEVPYLATWLQNGVPGGQLVARSARSNGRELVQVFRLQRAKGAR